MKIAGINTLKEYARLSGVQNVIQTKPQKIPEMKKAICSVAKEQCNFRWGYPLNYRLNRVYNIDLLRSTGRGTGTQAIKEVVRRSLADPETSGRVTLTAANIDLSTPHPFAFYYKLGFRPVSAYFDKFGRMGANVPYTNAQIDMYLPRQNIRQCLNYRNAADEKSSGLTYLYNYKR